MKKWLRFFCLGFFSDKISREGAKRGYTNFFLGLILSLAFIFAGFVGGDLLPLTVHYNNSPDFRQTVYTLLSDRDSRIDLEIKDGFLLVKDKDGQNSTGLLINTLENATDKQNYSANGYEVVVDLHPADTLAEVEIYYLSNDGKDLKISQDEYLSLSEVARLNFDFKMRYTGRALELNDQSAAGQMAYLLSLEGDTETQARRLTNDFAEGKIKKDEYYRSIYEMYFVSCYPEISEYESTSKVPLLRNYYYHNYISQGVKSYLFIFDDYLTASFESKGGIDVSFYGFYNEMENGSLVGATDSQAAANKIADSFMKNAISSIAPLTLYAYAVNIFTLIPFIALMPLVVTLLAYSILKLRGVDSITSFGAMFKILGSYVWFSSLVAAILTVILSFFLNRDIVTALPLVIFFIALAVRSLIFAVREAHSYVKKLEQEETVLTEA